MSSHYLNMMIDFWTLWTKQSAMYFELKVFIRREGFRQGLLNSLQTHPLHQDADTAYVQALLDHLRFSWVQNESPGLP